MAKKYDDYTPPVGYNASVTRFNCLLASMEPISMKDIDAIKERTAKYFDLCQEYDVRPSIPAYALSLGIHRKTLWAYRAGACGDSQEVRDFLERVVTVIESTVVGYMQDGHMNPVSAIFLTKNFFGYKDQSEVVVAPTQRTEEYSLEDIKERYLPGNDKKQLGE